MKKKNFALVDVIVKEDTPTIEIVPLTKKGLPSKIGYSQFVTKEEVSRIYVDDKIVYGKRNFLDPVDYIIENFGPGLVIVIGKETVSKQGELPYETIQIFESYWGQLHSYHFQNTLFLEVVGNTVISTIQSVVYHTKLRDNYGRRAGIRFESATYLDEGTLLVMKEEDGISKGIKTLSYIDTKTFEVKKTRKFFEGIEL